MTRLTSSTMEALVEALGHARLSTSPDDLDATSHDTWPLTTKWAMAGRHPNRADCVVRLSSFDEVPGILEVAARERTPVTVRALGSSVTGQPLPVFGGIVLDVSGIPATFDVNESNMTVTVTASHHGGDLEDALNARGMTLGHSPQSLYRSTVGGWLSTLATGQFSSLYGGIEDLVVGYTVILATGETVELTASPRAAMGPDLRQVFLGSEGTLGVISSVTLKVFRVPACQILQTFTMPSIHDGLVFLRQHTLLGLRPFLVRLYDADEASHAMADPTFKQPVLFLGSRGMERMAHAEMETLTDLVEHCGGQAIGPSGAERWMVRRYDFATVENLLALPGGYAETIEVAHTWDRIEELYHALKEALSPLSDEVLSHFSHVYTQGSSLYVILLGRATNDAEAIDRIERMWSTAMATCLEMGAELSHHHGGGLARSPYARRSLGSAHLVLRRLKAALDPDGILNPGKLGL